MSWSKALLFTVLTGLLTACGFRPLYGDFSGAKVMPELETIFIVPIADRGGQILRNELLSLINPRGVHAHANYQLSIGLAETESRQLQRTDETATRADLRLNATFTLNRLKDNEIILSGGSISLASYDLVDAEYVRIAAKENARIRAAKDMARDIRSRLSTFFLNPPTQKIVP